jgi:heterogeneous nuclear ribonucleoprotein C1/C2
MTPQMNAPSHNSGPPAQVGSVTNDPNTARSRVFVGNLNTIALTKEDVEQIFSRYGMVTGLSMHKGYAFVQYGNQLEARRACGAEDGMTYAGQALGVLAGLILLSCIEFNT